jgi:hypothetical protein
MSKSSSSSSSSGIGFAGLLTVAFIVLKLIPHATPANPNGHIIDWSWWWVLSPLWISALVGLTILIVLGIGFLIYLVFKGKK